MSLSFADPTVPISMDVRNAWSSRDDRLPAVDHHRLPGDEVVIGDEANDGLRDVVGGRHTAERGAVGAAIHQAVIVGAQRGLHPAALAPARRYGVEVSFLRPHGSPV